MTSQASIRGSWQRRLAAYAQLLVAVDPNAELAAFRVQAERLLRRLPSPANHGERMIAQAVLTALSLRRVGLDVRDVVKSACGDQGVRLIALPYEASVNHQGSPVAERARAIIDCEYASSGLTTQRLARSLHVHRNRLSLEFREAFELSIKDYIARRRVLAAADLLTNSRQAIGNKAVAAAVGYRGSSFYRNFKQTTGTTPARYRRG